jgi:hypothetical protein
MEEKKSRSPNPAISSAVTFFLHAYTQAYLTPSVYYLTNSTDTVRLKIMMMIKG